MNLRKGARHWLHPMSEMIVPAIMIESRLCGVNLGFGFGFFHDRGLDLNIMGADGFKHEVSNRLPVTAGMEIVTEVVIVPNKLSSQSEQRIGDIAFVHCDGANDEIAADVFGSAEREVASFIGEDV